MSTQSSPRIVQVLAVPGVGAGYYEDVAALRAEPVALPLRFAAPPVTQGFRAVREKAEAVSVGLVLDSGQVAWGDCVGSSEGGQYGRDPVFRSADGLATIRAVVAPALERRLLGSFRDTSAFVDELAEAVEVARPVGRAGPDPGEGVSRRALVTLPARLLHAARGDEEVPTERVTVERPLHSAVRYGVSQALLRAVALARGLSVAGVLAEEWDLPLAEAVVPMLAQSGHERYYDAEKMIVHRVASLPRAAVDNVAEQVGEDGIELLRFARWLKSRIGELGDDGYAPTIHLDARGALGAICGENLGRVLGHLSALEQAVQPYALRVEDPVLLGSRAAQIEALKTLREYVHFRKMKTELVADQWANSLDDVRAFVDASAADMIHLKTPDLGNVTDAVEAVRACRAGGAGALLGGSATETVLAAQVAVHVAMATRADLILARPGLGVDEAVSVTRNEMARLVAEIDASQLVRGG
jgi:methylaspartate ammonia-lyase